MIFDHIDGNCRKQDGSFYNQEEIDAVLRHIDELLQCELKSENKQQICLDDIGVVTPYRLQCDKIKKRCVEKNYDGITVGTAEVFQGLERSVMIISTVRTDADLGFVCDPQVRSGLIRS